MSTYATKQDVEEIVGKAVDKAVTDLSEIISGFAQQVDSRFNQVEAKVVGLESRLERVEEKITEQDQKFDRLLSTEPAAGRSLCH